MNNELSGINLKNYSSSRNFIGYCSYLESNIKTGAVEAIGVVSDFFSTASHECFVLSSLGLGGTVYDLESIYGYTASDVEKYISPAVGSGLICAGSDSNEIISRNFFYGDTIFSNAIGCCYSLMALGGLDGHFFIVDHERGLIVYPHDDTGFGLFSLNEKNSAKKFFSGFNPERFEVKIWK